MTAAGRYLAGLATSRPLYRVMFEEGIGLLPPATQGKGPERIVSHKTLGALAKQLGCSRTTVKADLDRLVNYGWVLPGAPRLLGHREGQELHLLADVAARQAMGEGGVVTQFVLHDLAPKAVEIPAESGTARGGARRWRYVEGADDYAPGA